jgi:hypothetical protein
VSTLTVSALQETLLVPAVLVLDSTVPQVHTAQQAVVSLALTEPPQAAVSLAPTEPPQAAVSLAPTEPPQAAVSLAPTEPPQVPALA